jgi:hypothetical protein
LTETCKKQDKHHVGYRPYWWPKENGEMLDIFHLCQTLHMDHTGACQDLKSQDRDFMIEALEWARDNWKHSVIPYDHVVFNLVCITLDEKHNEYHR